MDGNDTTNSAVAATGGDIANDFFGHACQVQPQGNQLLVVSRNFRSPGCDLQSYAPPAAGSNDLDVLGLYKELRPSVGYLKVKGVADGGGKDAAGTAKEWGGSGSIVAKEANDVLVLTDDHVPLGVPDQHVKPTSMEVVLGNNKAYEATVIARDPAHDLALVKVNTGADTGSVGKAVKIADQQSAADGSQNVITMGQPYTSHSIYTSTGTLGEVQKRSDINYMIKPLPGEDGGRPIYSMTMSIHEGFSGAGVFNKKSELVSLDDLATSPFTSVSTPVTRAMVDDLIAHRTDNPGGK